MSCIHPILQWYRIEEIRYNKWMHYHALMVHWMEWLVHTVRSICKYCEGTDRNIRSYKSGSVLRSEWVRLVWAEICKETNRARKWQELNCGAQTKSVFAYCSLCSYWYNPPVRRTQKCGACSTDDYDQIFSSTACQKSPIFKHACIQEQLKNNVKISTW